MKTRAKRHGDEYVLNGSKQFITHGSIADTLVVFAQTDPEADHRGISAFVLEREKSPWKAPKIEHKLGIRGSPTAQLVFEDVKVPAANRLREEGAGFKIALAVLDRSRPGIGAQALGIAEGAFAYGLSYVKERQQFGQAIASFQGTQFMLADIATQIEAAPHLVLPPATPGAPPTSSPTTTTPAATAPRAPARDAARLPATGATATAISASPAGCSVRTDRGRSAVGSRRCHRQCGFRRRRRAGGRVDPAQRRR